MRDTPSLQNAVAIRLLAAGIRLPLSIDERNPRLIRDADGDPKLLAMSSGSLPADITLAVMVAMIVNEAAGVAMQADPQHALAAE